MSNIQQLLRALESRPGMQEQIAILHDLNTALTMASGHPSQTTVGGVIQTLVPLLSGINNEVVLLAIRALITCIDITPRTATSLVESGAVTPMCRRLLKIQDMDVAEACLKCLHLLSKDNPRAVLEAGGAKACLAFFDFFPLELQQNALSTVARLVAPGVCGRREDIRRAREILPFLRECLQKQQAGGAVAGGLSVGFHGGGISVAGSGSGGDVRRNSTASGGGTLRGKDSASDASQMASLCLERMVVSFSTPIESTTERRSVSRKLRRSRSNFSFRAPPRPCERQRPPSLRVANENPAPGTSETPSDPLGAPAVTEAAATADDREPVAKGSKQKLATEREEGQNDREEEALTPEDVGDTPSRSLSSPSSPSSSGDGGGSGNGPKGESRPPAENKGEDVPMDEGGSAADGEGETTAGAAAAASSSYSVLMKGKGKARASNVGASSSAPPLPAASDGGARNEEWIAAISSADGGVALGDPLVDDGSMVDDAREMAIESLVEMSQKGNRAACDEKDVPPAVDAASAMTLATVGDGLLDVVGFLGMEVDGDEGGEKGDEEKEAVKTNVGDGRSERACAGAEDFYYDLDGRAAGTRSSCKAPVAAPHGGKKEQERLAGGLKAWQVAFVLEIAEGGVLSAWSKTLEDSVKALEGANGDLAPGWRLQSRLLSTIARVVSAAPVAVQALFDVGMPRLLRRILADYVRCDLVTMGAPSGIGSANSEARWKPSTLADGLIGEERLLAALGLATAMLPPPSGKAKDSKASSSRRGKGTTRSRGSATAATTLSSCVRAVEGEPKSMDVNESPDGCQDAGRRALEGLGEDSVTGEKTNDSDGGDCTDDDEGLPPDLEQAAVAAAVAAAGKRRREKRGGSSIGRGHFGARDAYEAGGDGGVEETKVAAQGMGERSPAAATATADGTGGPSEDANRGGGGPDGDAWNLAIDPRTTAKTNSSVSSPSLLPAIGGSEVGEEHRQHMTGVEGPTAAAAPRYDAREENNGVGVSANGDPAETAQAQARARRVAEVALKAAAADAAAAASAARAAREAAAAAAAGASGAEWACSACTFINHGSGFGRVCEVCGTPNASAVAAVTAGEAGVFFGGAALEARLQARFRGGRGVGSSGGGMSIWESDAMGGDDDGDDDGSGIPGFPPHWHRGVGAGRGGGNPETVDSRNQAEATVEEDHEDEDDDKNSDKFAPDDKVFVRLRHVYGQDEGLFHEFSRELLAPLLRLVPSGLSSPEAVRLVAAALVSLRQNSVECLLRKEFAEELAAALYRLLSKREHALRTGALAVAKAVLQSRSPEELGEASFSRGKSAGTAGGQEMKSFPPPSTSATDRAVYYREVFARHGVLKLMEGSHGEHPSPAFDAEVLRAPSTSSSSSGSPQPLHPTLVNLCGIAARLDPSSPPDPRRLDCVDQNNGDRHGGGRLPRTAKDEEVVVSPAGEQSTSKGKGKAVCPQGGERKETGGSSSCVSSGLSLRGVPGDGPGPKKFAAWDALAKENGFKGGKDGDGSDISLAFSDLTRTLKGHLGGVTTFEAEESGVLRALLRALLNGARGNGSSLGALAAGEESAESMPEEYTAPCRKQTHVAPSEGVHWKGDGGENPPSSFDNGLAPMEAEPVGAVESPEGYGVASMVTPSGSSETPGATFIKREFVDPDEAQLVPVAALQPSPSSPRREGDSTIVAATDGDVRSGSEASSSEVLDWRGAAVGTRLTGSDFYLEVGKALLTPDEDGRLPMESLISTTQGCLQALTDDVVVVHHGGDTEAAHYRSLVRPFTVLLSPGPCPPRASPAVPDDHASSHSSEPRPGSATGVKDEILLPLSGSAAGDDGGDAEEVPKCTASANAAAAATAASTGGRIGGSSMDSDSGVSTSGVGRDPNACAAVTETRMRGGTKEEGDSAPQQQPSSSLGVSTSTFSVRAGETRKGGRREAAIAERMEAQAGLLKSLSLGLHPVLLVEPLTTVREVIKWYTVQLGKAFKLHRRRQRQERQRAAQEEAQSRVIAAAAAAASALAAAASATEAATPSADSLDAHGGSCSSSATTVGEGTDRPEKKPRSSSPNIATPLLTTSEGSPIPDESPVTTRGKAATAANTGSGWNTPKRMLPDRAAKRNSGLAHSSGSKTFRGARKTRVSRRNSTSSLSSSVSGHAGGDSDMMAAQEAKGESIDIELAVSRATDAAATAPPAGADGDGGGAAASTAALSSVGQRAAKRRRASSTRAEAEAASGEEGEGGGEGGSSTPRSGRGPASSRSSSRSRVNESTAATVKTEEDEGSNTRLRKRWKVEGRGSSSGVVMAAGSIAAPSPASGSSQGSVPGLGKKKGSTVGGGGMESGEGGRSAGGKSKLEPTRLKPGREVFCCFRPSQGEDRSGMWYRGTVGVHHRDGTLDVRFDDGDLRINIPRSHVTIILPSVVKVRQEKRPWCNLWSPEQQQATLAAISTVAPGSGAGGPSAATATETATAAMETSLKVEEEPTHPVDGSTGGGGVDGDHAQERPGTVDTLSQSFARLAAEESREEMHRAAAASRSPGHRRRSRSRSNSNSNSTPPSPSTSTKPNPVPPPPSLFRGVQTAAAAAAEAASASSSGTRSTKEAKAPSTGPPPVSSSRSGAGGPSSGNMDAAAALERELALLRHARSMQDARNVVGGFGLGLGGGLDECGGQGGVTSALATGAWPAELQEAAAAAGLALPPFPGGRGRGGVLPPSGHGLSGVGGRASGTTLRMTIPGMVDEDSPAGPGVRIQLMSTRRDAPPRPAPGPSSAPESSSSAARQDPGASESRPSETPGEDGSSRNIDGGVEEKEGASDGQPSLSPTRGQPGATSGGGVEGGVAPLGKGEQESKEGDSGGVSSSPSMSASGSGSRLASASPAVASTRGETAAATPSAAAEATSTATEGRPVTRQSSAAPSAGGGGSSSSEPTAAAAPGRRSSKRKRSTSRNAGGSGVAGDSGAADASAGAAVDGRVLRRASTSSWASTTMSRREPQAYLDRSSTSDELDEPVGIKGWFSAEYLDYKIGARGHPQSGTNSSSSSRSRSTTGRKTRASAAAAAAASSISRRSSAPPEPVAAVSRRGDEDDAEAEPKHSKRRSSLARGSGARSRAASTRRRRASTSPASAHADRNTLPMIPMFPPRGASSAGGVTSQAPARSMGGTEADEASAVGRSKNGGGEGESAGGSRDSVRFPRLQWTLRYHWDAASAANGDEKRVTDVDVTRGEISKGATIFEAVQLLMFKHSLETEGNVPRTSNWDLFKHRSMRVPLEQWGKSITLEFSPRRPKSSPISQVEGVSEVGARQSAATQQEESASAATTAPSSISPLPTAETPTTMETPTPGRKIRGSSKGDGRKRKNEKESRATPFKIRKGANASPSGGVQVYELLSVLTPGATPLDARLASLRALLEGGGIGAGLRFGEHMCLLAALQAFCEEWGPLRKRLALKGQVDDDVPDPHPSVLHDLAKRCVVAGLQRKVSRQACNPLALCSGSLPSWCVRLPAEFPTLFSLETRLALYKKTAFGMARAVAHIQKKAKNVEDQPQGSGSSESPNEMMVELAGVAGRGGGLLGHGGPDAAPTPLPELLRQLGRLGRLTVLLSRDSVLEMATFLFGLLVNGQQQPPHQRSIQPPASSGPEAGSSENRHHTGRASAPGRLGGGGGVVGGAGAGVRGFGGGGSGSSSRLGYGDFDVYNDDDDENYDSEDDGENFDGEEKSMTHEKNDEGGDGGGGVAEMELDEDVLSDAEEPDAGHGHGLPQQAEQPQPPLPSEAGDGSSAVTNAAENKDGNTGHGEEASRGRWALKDRRVATVEASVPPQHAGRQAENLADTESMLLVEFAGETGHGTGPTLEFYSLVCRELVRKGLGMWRGDDVSHSPPQRAAHSSAVRNGHEEKSKTSPTPEGLDGSEAGESGGKGSASREVQGGDGTGAFSQQDDMAVEEENPFLQVGPEGLFPAPLDVRNRAVCASVEARFRLLGRVMGKALKDGRMLDLPLALPLCSLIVGLRRHFGTPSPAAGSPGEGEDGGRGRFTTMEGGGLRGNAKPLTLADVGLVDAALGRSLESVAKLAEEVQRAKAFEEMNHDGRLSLGQGGPEKLPSPPPRSVSELEACAGALCLSWSLPGCPWYELKPGGANEDVAALDLAEWVHEVTRVFLVDSIVKQVEALVKGVSEVMDPSKLSLLTAPELQRLVGGEAVGGAGGDSEWEYHRIMRSLVCRHGYSVDSPQVKWLAQVMASLDHAGRRKFLRFVTGTPRLPIGGFAALRPRLTVVKKEVGSTLGGTPDTHLPSCSTCQVYLKLPAYTSKQALEAKLLHAITEGQDHFALD